MTLEDQVRQTVARGWCDQRNSHKEMDADLADAISTEVVRIFYSMRLHVGRSAGVPDPEEWYGPLRTSNAVGSENGRAEVAPNETPAPRLSLEGELRELINRNSAEAGSDTADFILAGYLHGCLTNFDYAVRKREEWHGRGAMLVRRRNAAR